MTTVKMACGTKLTGIVFGRVIFGLMVCLFFSACSPSRISEWNTGATEKPNAAKKQKITLITVNAEAPQQESNKTEPPSTPRLILEQGNFITSGIPGFGENALSALTGEYRIPDKTELVKVWLTGEFIFYDRWARRTSISGYTALQKAEDIGRVVSCTLNDNSTLVILLPKGQELSLEEEDRLITTLIQGLSGFSLGNLQNVSLPAMINW
jgi:hypothetical protein